MIFDWNKTRINFTLSDGGGSDGELSTDHSQHFVRTTNPYATLRTTSFSSNKSRLVGSASMGNIGEACMPVFSLVKS